MSEGGLTTQHLRGRAEFCRARGEIKTPELLEWAASVIEAFGQDAEERLDAKHESAGPKDDAQNTPS